YVLHRAVRKGREVPEEVRSPVAAANLGDDERIEPHAAAPFCSNRRSSPASPPRIVREARKTGIPLVRWTALPVMKLGSTWIASQESTTIRIAFLTIARGTMTRMNIALVQ